MLQIDQETKEKLIALEMGDREILRKHREPGFLKDMAENRMKLLKSVQNFLSPETTPRTRKIAENFIEKQIAFAFRFHGDRIQFDMFAIPSIYRYCRKKIFAGEDLSTAMEEAVRLYRLPESVTVH